MLRKGAESMKTVLILALALLATATSGTSVSAKEVVESASLPYLTLKVTLTRTVDGTPRLDEEFSTSDPANHNVFCISGFFDVEYLLKDASGRIMPATKDPWRRGTDMQYVSGMSWNPKGPSGPDPCKAIKADKAFRFILLSYYYPSLRPGTYTLQITLAPRGRSDRATLAPLAIKI
jgi:hypothetical protein